MKKDGKIKFFFRLLIVVIVVLISDIGAIFGEELPEETLEEGDIIIRTSPDGRMDDWWGVIFTKNAGYVRIYVGGFEGLKL